jgi:chemotaxis signal transduction protein
LRDREPPLSLLRLACAGRAFALEVGRARRVERDGRLPGLPVHDLGQLLGLPSRGAGSVIVLDGWGLRAEYVAQAHGVPADRLAAFPALVAGACGHRFAAVVDLDEGPALLLAPERLRPAPGPLPPSAWPAPGPLPPPSGSGAGHLLLFRTHEAMPGERPLSFGAGLAQVVELVEVPRLIPVPTAPAWLLGLAPWQGRFVPVLDLARKLGLRPGAPGPRARLLVLRASAEEAVGVLVRPEARVVPLPVAHRPCSRPLPILPGQARGAFDLGGETVVVPALRA